MIRIIKDSTSTDIIVTLSESIQDELDIRFFLFDFICDTTREEIKFILNQDDDEGVPERYNKFNINPSVIFGSSPIGFYKYYIYEQFDGTSLTTSGKTLLECGKMQLVKNRVVYLENTSNNTYIQNET